MAVSHCPSKSVGTIQSRAHLQCFSFSSQALSVYCPKGSTTTELRLQLFRPLPINSNSVASIVQYPFTTLMPFSSPSKSTPELLSTIPLTLSEEESSLGNSRHPSSPTTPTSTPDAEDDVLWRERETRQTTPCLALIEPPTAQDPLTRVVYSRIPRIPVPAHCDHSLCRHLFHRAYFSSRPSLSCRPYTSKSPRQTPRQRPSHSAAKPSRPSSALSSSVLASSSASPYTRAEGIRTSFSWTSRALSAPYVHMPCSCKPALLHIKAVTPKGSVTEKLYSQSLCSIYIHYGKCSKQCAYTLPCSGTLSPPTD
jgi:hypothetical protein